MSATFTVAMLTRFMNEPYVASIAVASNVWRKLLETTSRSSLCPSICGVWVYESPLLPDGVIVPLDGAGRPFEWFACDACGTKRPGSRGAPLACATCPNFWRAPE